VTNAIDIMNYTPLVAPGISGTEFEYEEFQICLRTTFKSMVKDGKATTLWGREVDIDETDVEVDPTLHIEEAVAQLDEAGYDIVVLSSLKMWSYYWHHKMIMEHPEELAAEAVKAAGDRFIGSVGYNPLRIDDSLRRIETFVRDFGFRYAYFHPMTFGIAPNDRRCYPLYAKCVELGIPVGFQVGHSAEVLPSEVGRPYYVDDVAIEFPTLKINMSHTGWPWTGEFCSMIWRHPNVYGDISAYFPKTLDPQLIEFMDSGRGRNKILYGTNGFDLKRFKEQFESLEISDKTKERVLRQNAIEFLGL
jgi:predicted TIM-barrel fold metal-dependent hydrolase